MVSQPWPRRQNSGPRTTSELAADLLLAAGMLRAGEWGSWLSSPVSKSTHPARAEP